MSAIEAALDALYAAKPEDFVATRAALAKKHGAKVAAALKKRRKPTQTAYALNQLARRHPDAIADLVDAGRMLARAQRKALRGDAADVRDAIERQRTVIRDRMADVATLVDELGIDAAHLPAIAEALQAGLIDPAVGEQLEAGRLENPPEAPSGFPSFDGLPFVPPKARASARRVANAKSRAKADADARAKADAEARATAKRSAAAAAAREKAERLEAIASDLTAEAKNAVRAAEKASAAATNARKHADSI